MVHWSLLLSGVVITAGVLDDCVINVGTSFIANAEWSKGGWIELGTVLGGTWLGDTRIEDKTLRPGMLYGCL